MKTVCCLCRRLKKDEQTWITAPEIAPGEPVSHGYCPDCFRLMVAKGVRRREKIDKARVSMTSR